MNVNPEIDIHQDSGRSEKKRKVSRPGAPLISVITVTYNSADTLEQTISSVLSQTYNNIEYIIIDGGSRDHSQDIIRKYEDKIDIWVSESDRGIYDAMNKGIELSSGDYVGMLNADDYFSSPDVIKSIAEYFCGNSVDAVHGNLDIVDRSDGNKVQRHYRLNFFKPSQLRLGIVPAHPTFYCKRDLYKKAGLYKTDYRVAADTEMIARLLIRHKATLGYIDRSLVVMRSGGISNNGFLGRIHQNFEIVRACRENGLYTNILLLMVKIPVKLMQYFRRQP